MRKNVLCRSQLSGITSHDKPTPEINLMSYTASLTRLDESLDNVDGFCLQFFKFCILACYSKC